MLEDGGRVTISELGWLFSSFLLGVLMLFVCDFVYVIVIVIVRVCVCVVVYNVCDGVCV